MTRDYNAELRDTNEHKYAYSFDIDVMHSFMMKSFTPFFVEGIMQNNVLELGSFEGAFTKRLQDFFHNTTCIEASSEAIDIAKQNKDLSNVTFINDTFEAAKLDRRYDNIILTHVLEHLDDPIAILSRIRNEWLNEGGRLFVACPNANAASRQIH